MPRADLRSAGRNDVVAASAARTTSGDSGVISNYGGVSQMVVQLDITAASGVSPPLDVVIEDTVDGTNYNTLASFTQATAANRQVQRITTVFTDTLRVRWTVGGAAPSFTFSVTIYGE